MKRKYHLNFFKTASFPQRYIHINSYTKWLAFFTSLTSHESKSSLESAVHESKSSPKSLFMRLKCDSSPSRRLEFPSLVHTHIVCKHKLLFWMWLIAINRFAALDFLSHNLDLFSWNYKKKNKLRIQRCELRIVTFFLCNSEFISWHYNFSLWILSLHLAILFLAIQLFFLTINTFFSQLRIYISQLWLFSQNCEKKIKFIYLSIHPLAETSFHTFWNWGRPAS